MSHWWRQEGHPAKIAPMHQWKSYLGSREARMSPWTRESRTA